MRILVTGTEGQVARALAERAKRHGVDVVLLGRPALDLTDPGSVRRVIGETAGDVVVNAAKVKLTGRKEDQKVYRRHSGYLGGLKEERAGKIRAQHPIRLVEEAVRGMLPKTKLGDAMYRKLKVYAGKDHPHQAQQPTAYEVA